MENIFDITTTDISLYNAFCKQTRRTFWTFLHNLAQREDIYSTHLTNFGPYKEPEQNDYYVFSNGSEIVILTKDTYTLKQENTDKERGIYCGSPINGLVPVLDITRFLMRRTNIVAPDVKVQSIMLSDRECRDDLMECMYGNEFPFFIIDNLRTLNKRPLEVNEEHGEKGKSIIDAILHCNCISPEEDEDTVENRLKEYEDEDEDENQNENEDGYEDESYDDEEEDSFDRALQEVLDSAAEDARERRNNLFSVTHNEIEHNATASVKVEILRCNHDPHLELMKLVGCTEIKRRMDDLLSLSIYNKLMLKHFPNCKQHDISLHSIFFGRPGTGKTTVCKIFGALLHDAGVLSSGHVVVCDRGTFVGSLWGDEERAVREVLEIAKGGVLMIDEAYLLNSKHDHDPGKLVLQLLMNILADENKRDIAVVLCGYKEPMKKLLAMNPGLDSRFPNKFEFQDFNVDELLEITQRRINEYEYHFTDKAWDKYRRIMADAYQTRDPDTWGNARFVANQLEQIYIKHASRCVRHTPKDISEMRTLTSDDIQPIEVPKPRTRMGFC